MRSDFSFPIFLWSTTKERSGDGHVNDAHSWPLTSKYPVNVIKRSDKKKSCLLGPLGTEQLVAYYLVISESCYSQKAEKWILHELSQQNLESQRRLHPLKSTGDFYKQNSEVSYEEKNIFDGIIGQWSVQLLDAVKLRNKSWNPSFIRRR